MSDRQVTFALVITVILFFTSVIAGWVGSTSNPAMGEELMKIFEKDVAGNLKDENPADMAVMLFVNNLEACILLFLGGATAGILTVFILGLNGVVIGAIMEIVHNDHSPLLVATAVVPHGIFEVPAFIIAGTLGLCLAWSLVAEWKTRTTDMAADAKRYARTFILYVVPLVAIAAGVEAFITPAAIHLVA